MTITEFKKMIQYNIDKIDNLAIIEMKFTGHTEEESQQICILNCLGKLEQAINGTVQEDLK